MLQTMQKYKTFLRAHKLKKYEIYQLIYVVGQLSTDYILVLHCLYLIQFNCFMSYYV